MDQKCRTSTKFSCRKVQYEDNTKPSTNPTAVRMFKITAKMDQKIEDRIKHFDSGSPLSSARLPCNRLCVWGDMQLLQHNNTHKHMLENVAKACYINQ